MENDKFFFSTQKNDKLITQTFQAVFLLALQYAIAGLSVFQVALVSDDLYEQPKFFSFLLFFPVCWLFASSSSFVCFYRLFLVVSWLQIKLDCHMRCPMLTELQPGHACSLSENYFVYMLVDSTAAHVRMASTCVCFLLVWLHFW